jgi:hypothetical protein
MKENKIFKIYNTKYKTLKITYNKFKMNIMKKFKNLQKFKMK